MKLAIPGFVSQNSIMFTFCLFIVLGCDPTKNKTIRHDPNILIGAESYSDILGNVLMEDMGEEGTTVRLTGKGWLEYIIHIPEAGFYHIEINSIPEDTIPANYVLQDVTGSNPNEYRTIAGPFYSSRSSEMTPYTLIVVDGIPMSPGTRRIRILFEGGKSSVDWLLFRKIADPPELANIYNQSSSGEEWELVWSDEFNDGGLPDTNKWDCDVGFWHEQEREVQYFTPANFGSVWQENGNLVLEARLDDSIGWTSARLHTRNTAHFLHGRMDLRIKYPAGSYPLASIALESGPSERNSKPNACRGIQLCEYSPGSKLNSGIFSSSILCNDTLRHTSSKPIYESVDQFHDVRLEWSPNSIIVYSPFDKIVLEESLSGACPCKFEQPLHMVVSLGVLKAAVQQYNINSKVDSSQFLVDYIRVFGKE